MEIARRYPVGYRFSPTDEELISHYLKRRIRGLDSNQDAAIAEVEICKFEPWDLPAKSVIWSDQEWFFFSPANKKYINGTQAKRATKAGFWKATGKERMVKSGKNVIGSKRSLVFHIGRSPRGVRTEWIIHEYWMKDDQDDKFEESYAICRLKKNQDFSTKDGDPNAASTSCRISSPCNSGLGASSNICDDFHQREGTQILIGAKTDPDMKSQEDDCFTDILNDDIVHLDESLLGGTRQVQNVDENPGESLVLPEVAENEINSVCTFMSTAENFQGTANRRIRLGRVRYRNNHVELPGLLMEKEKVPNSAVKSSFVMLFILLLCATFVALMIFVTLFFAT